MLPDLSALSTLANNVLSIARELSQKLREKTDSTFHEKFQSLILLISELQDRLIKLQTFVLSLQEKNLQLQNRITELERENSELRSCIKEYESWEKEAQQYKLAEFAPGTGIRVYVPVNPETEPHHLCPYCFENRRKSLLQCIKKSSSRAIYRCHHCGFQFEIRLGPSIRAEVI